MEHNNQYQNVWEALIDCPHEALSLSIKSKLTMVIVNYMSENGMTQSQVAKVTGVSEPRISNLVKGKIDKFSIDMLIGFISRLGLKADVVFDRSEGFSLSLKTPLDSHHPTQ